MCCPCLVLLTQMVIPSSCSLHQLQRPLNWRRMVTTAATAPTLDSTRRLPHFPSSRTPDQQREPSCVLQPGTAEITKGVDRCLSLLLNVKALKAQACLCTCKGAGFLFPFFLFQSKNAALSHVNTSPSFSPTLGPAQSCISVHVDPVQIDAFKCIHLELMHSS